MDGEYGLCRNYGVSDNYVGLDSEHGLVLYSKNGLDMNKLGRDASDLKDRYLWVTESPGAEDTQLVQMG